MIAVFVAKVGIVRIADKVFDLRLPILVNVFYPAFYDDLVGSSQHLEVIDATLLLCRGIFL